MSALPNYEPIPPGDRPAVVDFFLERQPVQRSEREAKEQADSSVQQKKSLAESLLHLLACSLHCGGIGNTPMGGHRLAPHPRADFVGGIVTDGETEIEPGSIRLDFVFAVCDNAANEVC